MLTGFASRRGIDCAPSRCSLAWAEWTAALSAPESPSSPRQRPTPGGEPSSPTTSPASPAPLTFVKRRRAGEDDPSPESWAASQTAPTVDAAGHGPRTATLVVQAFDWQQGSRHVPLTEEAELLRKDGSPAVLISSPAGPPARTSASPAAAPASPGSGAPSSGSSCGSQMSLLDPGDGALSKTSPVFLVPVGDGISLPSSGRWPTSAFTTSPGEFATLGTGESPNDGGVSSSLPDVLEETVPARYSLSPRAARGILRRAQKRGRELPEALRTALEALAGQT